MSRLLLQNIHPFSLSPLITTMPRQLPCPAEPAAHLPAPSLPSTPLRPARVVMGALAPNTTPDTARPCTAEQIN